MDVREIEKLAQLARIELGDAEKKDLLKDIEEILGFVNQLESVDVSQDGENRIGVPHNVMREDKDPHESGIHTGALLNEAPDHKDGYIKVKKIL